MTQMIPFIRNRWDELLITGIYLNSIVASIFTWNVRIVLAVTIGGLILLAIIFGLRALWNKRNLPLHGENIAFQVPRKALVFTVGNRPGTIPMAIKPQRPEYVGFICSDQSELVANQLIEDFGYDKKHSLVKRVNPQDVKEIRIEANFILDWLTTNGLKPSDIAADITGGMTPMSLGVFSVTEERQVDSQYITSQYDEKNRPVPGTQEAVFVSRYTNV
jgi:hypothetical protein